MIGMMPILAETQTVTQVSGKCIECSEVAHGPRSMRSFRPMAVRELTRQRPSLATVFVVLALPDYKIM